MEFCDMADLKSALRACAKLRPLEIKVPFVSPGTESAMKPSLVRFILAPPNGLIATRC